MRTEDNDGIMETRNQTQKGVQVTQQELFIEAAREFAQIVHDDGQIEGWIQKIGDLEVSDDLMIEAWQGVATKGSNPQLGNIIGLMNVIKGIQNKTHIELDW